MSALMISIFLKDISVVLNFIGMVSSPLMCFIIPGLFYLKSV